MKSPEFRPVWKPILLWLGGATTLLYFASRFVPCAPPSHHGEIEDSYIQFLHEAFAQHLQFGRDVVFTFGPWGFLYGGYHPATHLISVLAWLALSGVICWAGWRVARHFSRNTLAAWVWLMAFAAVAGLPVFTLVDARLKAPIVLLWLLHFFVEDDRPVTGAQAALAAALGLLSLVKFNVLVETALVMVVIALDDVFRHRRFPWLLSWFGATLLLFWVVAGQHLSALGPFLRGSWQLTGGYSESMMGTGVKPIPSAACFLFCAGMAWTVAGCASWRRHRFFSAFPQAGLGFILFTVFKHGYVRQDCHEAAAALDLLVVSLAVMAVAWPLTGARARHSVRTAALASILLTILVSWFAAAMFSRYYDQGLPTHLRHTFSARNILAPAKLLLGTAHLREGYEAYRADIRADTPLPPIQGPVDTYPGNGGALLAWGMTYHPRPILHSYTVYTPQLAELNVSSLRSARAPASIVMQISPVDDHFPSLDDGASWPELLTRYDVRQVEWPFALLQRSGAPRSWGLTSLGDLSIRFGEPVQVPPLTNGPIWATFDIPRTFQGNVVSALYKPPILWLSVSTRDGGSSRYRLIPGMARSGFVLSPVIQNPVEFAALAAAEGLPDLADKEVLSVRLSAATESGSTACYVSPLRLRLYRLDYPGQDLGNLAGWRGLKSQARMLSHAIALQGGAPQPAYLPGYGSVLRVASRSALQLALEGHPHRLKLGFGVLQAGGAAPPANGILFRVSALDSKGTPIPLWSQRVVSSGGGADQERQQAVIDLSRAASTELVLETLSEAAAQSQESQCYWSQVESE